MTEKQSVFVNSSAWISLVVKDDTNYPSSLSIFSSFATKTRLYISTFIVNETITKIRKILGQKQAFALYKKFKKQEKDKFLTILPVEDEVIEQAMLLLQKHPTPNTFSLTDATNIILMEKYKIEALFSFDKDFRKLKIPHLKLLA